MKPLLPLAIGVLVGSGSAHSNEISESEIRDAGAKYRKNCMGCHQPPDLKFETDRAWIGQIRETS